MESREEWHLPIPSAGKDKRNQEFYPGGNTKEYSHFGEDSLAVNKTVKHTLPKNWQSHSKKPPREKEVNYSGKNYMLDKQTALFIILKETCENANVLSTGENGWMNCDASQ